MKKKVLFFVVLVIALTTLSLNGGVPKAQAYVNPCPGGSGGAQCRWFEKMGDCYIWDDCMMICLGGC